MEENMDQNNMSSQNSMEQQTPPAQNVGEAFDAPKMEEGPVSDDRTMALIAHIGGILAGFIVPLVIWLIQKEKSGFAYEHAKEALNFQITLIIGWLLAGLLSVLIIGFLLYPVLILGNIIFSIKAAMAANNGESYQYPFSIKLIK
jgi:uncharacterized Tic20 family protein